MTKTPCADFQNVLQGITKTPAKLSLANFQLENNFFTQFNKVPEVQLFEITFWHQGNGHSKEHC